jgi:hypothetical protein
MSAGRSAVPGRLLLLIAILAALVGGLFTLSFTYADHAPAPHDIRVAVVAPAGEVSAVSDGLRRRAPGAFIVIRARSSATARQALRQQQIRGALVLTGHGPAQVLTAGAAGLTLAQVVETTFGDVAHAAGRSVRAVDVVPLPAADRAGTSSYIIEIALLLPSVLGASALHLVGTRSRLWWRVAAAALFAVLVGGLAVLLDDLVLGALTGPWLAMWGIATLGALAFALTVAAVQTTFGLAATGVVAISLIFVGNAISGGAVPTGMLPGVYRQISPDTINWAIVHGVRAVVYFGGHGAGRPLLVLAVWAGAALSVLAVNDLLHSAARRSVAPERRPDVYATSGLAHAARMIRARRLGSA